MIFNMRRCRVIKISRKLLPLSRIQKHMEDIRRADMFPLIWKLILDDDLDVAYIGVNLIYPYDDVA